MKSLELIHKKTVLNKTGLKVAVVFCVIFASAFLLLSRLSYKMEFGTVTLHYSRKNKIYCLYTVFPQYQKNKSHGFAVVNIPPSFLFSFLLRSDSEQLVNHVGENVGKNFTEEDFKKGYELLSKYCDNHIVNMLFQTINNESVPKFLKFLTNPALQKNVLRFFPIEKELLAVNYAVHKSSDILSNIKSKTKFLKSTESQRVGKYGNYFVIDFRDLITYGDL